MVQRIPGAGVRKIEAGLRSAPAEEPKAREHVYDGPPPPAEVVHRQIRAAAVLPSALAVACVKHDAAIGQRCFNAGVCGDRLARRSTGVSK